MPANMICTAITFIPSRYIH